MKKMMIVVLMLVTMLFAGCDNNDGPFSTEYVNGELVTISGGKPASGMVEGVAYTIDDRKVVCYVADFDDGFIDGKAVSYDAKNLVAIDGTFKKKSKDTYDVDIKLHNGTIKGTMKLTAEELAELLREPAELGLGNKINLNNWFDKRAINASIDVTDYKATKKNGEYDGAGFRADTLSIKEWNYENGVAKEYVEKDTDGNLRGKRKIISDEVYEDWRYFNGRVIEYCIVDPTKHESYRLKWDGGRFQKFVTAEDRVTKYVNGHEIKVLIDYASNHHTIYVDVIDSTDNKMLDQIEISAEGHLTSGVPLEEFMNLYYKVMGSNIIHNENNSTSPVSQLSEASTPVNNNEIITNSSNSAKSIDLNLKSTNEKSGESISISKLDKSHGYGIYFVEPFVSFNDGPVLFLAFLDDGTYVLVENFIVDGEVVIDILDEENYFDYMDNRFLINNISAKTKIYKNLRFKSDEEARGYLLKHNYGAAG